MANKPPAWAAGGRTGPIRSFMDLKIFACEGLIAIIDERPHKEGEFTVVTPADMVERVNALMRKYRNQTPAEMTPAQRERHRQRESGSNNCMECVKEARFMGDPSDPTVQEYWMKHKRSNTIRISFSAGADPAGYPKLPPVPLGKVTGRTADIGDTITPSDLQGKTAMHVHRGPVKKQRNGIILLD